MRSAMDLIDARWNWKSQGPLPLELVAFPSLLSLVGDSCELTDIHVAKTQLEASPAPMRLS
jgi:hypothetical protein